MVLLTHRLSSAPKIFSAEGLGIHRLGTLPSQTALLCRCSEKLFHHTAAWLFHPALLKRVLVSSRLDCIFCMKILILELKYFALSSYIFILCFSSSILIALNICNASMLFLIQWQPVAFFAVGLLPHCLKADNAIIIIISFAAKGLHSFVSFKSLCTVKNVP